jgi:hypothetical protein
MVGGARFQQSFLEWTKQSNQLFLTVFSICLITWAVFAEKLPIEWRWQLSTTVGRVLLLLLLYIIHELTGWIPALLFAIAMALTWANRPLYKPASSAVEGFTPKESKAEGTRWFVERVLEENPKSIVEEEVQTQAIQDNSNVGNSRTSK